MPTDPVAALRGVTKRYGAHTALDALDLELAPGRVTALLGPNGAGKTTAVRILLGLAAPDAGEARLFGVDPRKRAARERVGVMLQVGKVPETLRVREHVELFRSYYPAPLPYDDVIVAAGLHGLDARPFGKLSGGEKQRVLFALALCGDPDLLVLDEPTVGLDVEARRAVWAEIRRLREAGRAVLLTTHYLDEADALADRVVVLARGTVVADGSPAAIKARVASRRVRCVTALPLAAVRALPGVQSARALGDATEILCAAAEPVLRELLARDASLSGLEVGGAGLEDAFLAVTAAPNDTEVAA
jgi:ABC-2 type transport system ATP-binding protein